MPRDTGELAQRRNNRAIGQVNEYIRLGQPVRTSQAQNDKPPSRKLHSFEPTECECHVVTGPKLSLYKLRNIEQNFWLIQASISQLKQHAQVSGIPQPPKIPFLGNLKDVDLILALESMKPLAKEYGEILMSSIWSFASAIDNFQRSDS